MKFKIEYTEQEINTLLQALATQPYNAVANIIHSTQAQAQAQLAIEQQRQKLEQTPNGN